MQNQQQFLSYFIVIGLTSVLFTLLYLFIPASQTDFYAQLEMTMSLGLIGLILSLISFDYLTKLPLKLFSPLLGIAIGALFFINVLGLQIINPTETYWLMKGDWAQHYLGWQFFRQESWQYPLGIISNFYYPMGSSIVYTDSLPLLALPLKLFSDYLPAEFQYIGGWLFFNYIMQGLVAGLLMRLLTPNITLQALGIAFFVWSPALIGRIAHDTLTTHWLLLAGIWLYFRTWHHPTALKPFAAWLFLVTVSALTHPYLVIMMWSLMGAFYLRWWLIERNSGFFSTSFQMMALLIVTFGCWWMSGLFLVSGDDNLATQGFGYYSMNLFAPLNSMNWSVFFREFPLATDGQGEGFNYLGLGTWVLLLWAMYELKRQPSEKIKPLLPLLFICLLLTLLALSHKVTLLQWTLFELQGDWLKYFAPFRSSGRFFWVVGYVLLFLALSVLITRNSVRTSFPLLTLAFTLQAADFYPAHYHFRHVANPAYHSWDYPLKSSQWEQLAVGRSHLLLIPPPNCGIEAAPYLPFSYFAMKHNMAINTGYVARLDTEKSAEYCKQLYQSLDNGIVNPEALYIVNPDYLQKFQQNATSPLHCQQLDGFWACVVSSESVDKNIVQNYLPNPNIPIKINCRRDKVIRTAF
jgi:hypothetical protein